MKKEKFLYEIIDSYACLVNAGAVIIENYCLKDCSEDIYECAESLKACLDFYDKLYGEKDTEEYTEEEIDAVLNYLIQKLKNETKRNIQEKIEQALKEHVNDPKKVIHDLLMTDKNGNEQEISKESLKSFIKELRLLEESELKRKVEESSREGRRTVVCRDGRYFPV